MDNHAPRDRQLNFRILRTSDAKEVLPQIKLRFDPQVSLTQSHEGHNMPDSRGSQVVKLKVVIPQKRAEEPVRWHAKSLLIGRRKGHHISSCRHGEHRVLRHPTSLELYRRHKPMLNKFLQVARCNSGRGPILLHHDSRRKEGPHFQDASIFFLFLFFLTLLFPSLFFSRHMDGGKERMADGAQGRSPASNPVASVVKWLDPLRHSKGLGKLSLPASPIRHMSH
jgi:hypothetical protein